MDKEQKYHIEPNQRITGLSDFLNSYIKLQVEYMRRITNIIEIKEKENDN